jgi:hypothetical protein
MRSASLRVSLLSGKEVAMKRIVLILTIAFTLGVAAALPVP